MKKEMPKDYNPWIEGIASYINGKFDGKGINVEIDTELSIVNVVVDGGEEYAFQGDEADELIKGICWRASEICPTETFEDNVINFFNERI